MIVPVSLAARYYYVDKLRSYLVPLVIRSESCFTSQLMRVNCSYYLACSIYFGTLSLSAAIITANFTNYLPHRKEYKNIIQG